MKLVTLYRNMPPYHETYVTFWYNSFMRHIIGSAKDKQHICDVTCQNQTNVIKIR